MKPQNHIGIHRRHLLAGAMAGGLLAGRSLHAHSLLPSGSVGHQPDGCILCQAMGRSDMLDQPTWRPSAYADSQLVAQADARVAPQRPSTRTSRGVWVVQPSWVLVASDGGFNVLQDHDVIIKADKIEAVRPRRPTSDPKVNAQGQMLFPGFISGHSHAAAGTLTRGWIEENPRLVPGPSRSYFPAMALIDTLSDEELDDLTALNVAEMVRSGCTTQVEMSLSTRQMKSYVRVATKYGLCGYASGMVPGMTRLGPIWNRNPGQLNVLEEADKGTLAEIADNLAYSLSINGSANGRIFAMMGPSVTPVFTATSFKALRDAARQLGTGIHLHIQSGGNPKYVKLQQEQWGMREMEIIQAQGLLDQRLFGAHCIGLEDLAKDLPIMANPNFTYVHCPSAGGAGQSASSQPYPEALAAGVNTSIGFDTHSNDFVENLKLATIGGRARARMLQSTSPVKLKEPTVWDAIQASTLGGAKGLGRSDLGRLEAGAKADLCTVDVSSLLVGNGASPREPWNNLMYANGLSVRNVMVDGDWKVRDGALTFADESRLKERGGRAAKVIWDKLDRDGFFVKMPR